MYSPSELLPSNARLSKDFQSENIVPSNRYVVYNSYQVVKVFPSLGTHFSSVMEELVFKVVVRVDTENLAPKSVKLDVLTNLKHLHNNDGEWHHIDLPYREAKDDDYHVYGQVVVLIEEGAYDFIFKTRTTCEKKGSFYPSADEYSTLVVKPPSNLVIYADILRVPYMSHMIGPIWVGNEWAGIQSKSNSFTHIICLADELQQPFMDFEGRCFCRAPMTQGIKNVINKETFKRAVLWVKRSLRDGYKILIYSKYGFGRSGCVMIGFVMMENSNITYEEAYACTFARRPVLVHKNLKEMCESLYRSPDKTRMSKMSILSTLSKSQQEKSLLLNSSHDDAQTFDSAEVAEKTDEKQKGKDAAEILA